jgi:spermidine/putrescine transport system permease protein
VDRGEDELTSTVTEEPAPPPGDEPAGAPTRRRQLPEGVKGNLLLLPTTIWLTILLVIPLLIVLSYSLGHRGVIDQIRFDWGDLNFENYKDALDPDFLPIFLRSIVYAGITTIACVLLGFPLAYWIARFSGRHRNVFLALVIIPFLTSYLIRVYAWQAILQRNGLLNSMLGLIGLGDDHQFLNTHFAVLLGLTYGFLPFMVLPLYASIERMDKSLVEASYDLGHGKASTLFRVIIPTVAPGLVAGTLLVFIPSVGDFVTPELLGGVNTQMFGNTIADQFGGGQNWPLGSAMAVLLMVFILVGVILYLRRVGEDAL